MQVSRPPTAADGAKQWPATQVFIAVLTLGLLGAIGTVAVATWPAREVPVAPAPAAASLTIDSRPQGADVVIGGVLRGQTPLKLALSGGRHEIGVTYGGVSRVLPVDLQPGSVVSQHVEFVSGPAPTTGRLEIGSDPPGAQVRVDNASRGTTPLSIASVAPGEHTVVISSGDTVVTRRVTVTAGATATVVASMTAAQATGGFVSFNVPIELQVFEQGTLVGTSAADRIMLPAGRHELQLVNAALEFRRNVSVQVAAGRSSTVPVALPDGSISVNALPWADVLIDGRPVGTTPLANIPVPIGRHEVVFRHPQLGERKQTVTVTATTPVRIGMNLQ
jgi:PEGA domain